VIYYSFGWLDDRFYEACDKFAGYAARR